MTLKLQSTNSDQILLGVDSQGVMIGVIPSNPPKNDALDVFHALIRFTNVVRAIGVLDSGGIFTTDDGKSRAVCHNLWDFSARVLATQSVRGHQAILDA